MNQIFDELSTHNFDMVSGECGFDNEKVREYLNLIHNINIKRTIQNIIEHTYYATWTDIQTKLFMAFEHFKTSIGNNPFIVVTTDHFPERVSSETLMIYLLWNQLKRLNLRGIYKHDDCEIINISVKDIVWIDDVVYSGGSFQNMLHILNITPQHHVHVVTSYINKNRKQQFNAYVRVFPIYGQVAYHTGLEIKQYDDVLIQRDSILNRAIPLYLDYKIASDFSTFKHIYEEGYVPIDKLPLDSSCNGIQFGSILKKLPSRKIIYDMEEVIKLSVTKCKN
jgi:hypothetical protein